MEMKIKIYFLDARRARSPADLSFSPADWGSACAATPLPVDKSSSLRSSPLVCQLDKAHSPVPPKYFKNLIQES